MRIRVATSISLVLLVLLGTTACNFIAPQATTVQYDPSDGVSADVGDVKVLNVLLLTEDGEEASLVASIVNTGTERVQIKLQYESGAGKVDKKFTVGAGETQSLGSDGGMTIILDDINAMPGAMFPVFVQYGNATGKQLLVPVLDGSLAEYQDLLP